MRLQHLMYRSSRKLENPREVTHVFHGKFDLTLKQKVLRPENMFVGQPMLCVLFCPRD